MLRWIKRNELLSYFVLTFAVSWAIWIPSMQEMSRPEHMHILCWDGWAPWSHSTGRRSPPW